MDQRGLTGDLVLHAHLCVSFQFPCLVHGFCAQEISGWFSSLLLTILFIASLITLAWIFWEGHLDSDVNPWVKEPLTVFNYSLEAATF